ncbi:hypothetical protein [Sphingobacterium haloxyli]|uniref:Uncharacterized protein n=1 Tax=Sphingobacterium haloxyli TaxID=2100533 RepID=A0A2S9J0T6_9SPHI|nr:hypothetical protein [Sphingobacterium haloxyli]PRD46393.1 hypothetical protein C5745_15575 [Sphingobacterium haloxyli]
MKTQNFFAENGQGPILAFAVVDPASDPATPNRGGEGNSPDEENLPDGGERIENLPPEQPDVDPLEREEPELDEIDENQPDEQPDIAPLEAPNPDIDEINPDAEPEINELSTPEPNIDRGTSIEPGTNPTGRDSRFI